VLAWSSRRGLRPWSQTRALIGATLAAVVFIGFPMSWSLVASGPAFDPTPAGVVERFGDGVRELVVRVVPWMGEWFPWWPITVTVVLLAFAITESRRRLFDEWGWAFWPLVFAPLAFLLAYHFMTPTSFEFRPYRGRYAYFFLPALVLVVATLAVTIEASVSLGRLVRGGLALVLTAGLVAQLPATAEVVTRPVSPDFVQAGRVIADTVPSGATVIYMTPLELGRWRHEFMKVQLDTSAGPWIADAELLAQRPRKAPTAGRVFVIVLDGECANSVYCDKPAPRWQTQPAGWDIVSAFDHFTLYASREPLEGRRAVLDALLAFAEAFRPKYGMVETYAAAGLLAVKGRAEVARGLVRRALRELDPLTRLCYREYANAKGINPFEAPAPPTTPDESEPNPCRT
jgi:hypothetical protein